MPVSSGKGGLPMNRRKTGPTDRTAPRASASTGRNLAGRRGRNVGRGSGKVK